MPLPCPHCGNTYSDRRPCCPEMAEQMDEQRSDFEDQCVEDELRERDEREWNAH